MRRFAWTIAAFALLAVALVAGTPAASSNFPERIDFPPGWSAEGIATGKGHTFFAVDSSNGAIYRGDYRTGDGEIIRPGVAGQNALGIFADNHNRLFVAGSRTCTARVYDADTGALIATYVLGTAPCLVNDVTVTNDGAYFTDTLAPRLFKIPIAPNGDLGATSETIPVPFSGGNGIEATPDGSTLIVVSITLSTLYRFDTATNTTTQIVANEPCRRGDGLILHGLTLYCAENLPSTAFPGATGDVAVYELSPDFSTATAVAHLNSASDPLVNPATMDAFGNHMWVVRRNGLAPVVGFHLTRLDLH